MVPPKHPYAQGRLRRGRVGEKCREGWSSKVLHAIAEHLGFFLKGLGDRLGAGYFWGEGAMVFSHTFAYNLLSDHRPYEVYSWRI